MGYSGWGQDGKRHISIQGHSGWGRDGKRHIKKAYRAIVGGVRMGRGT